MIQRAAALALFSVALTLPAADEPPAKNAAISLPTDYREWVFLSAGLGMNYGPAGSTGAARPSFDNVFVRRNSYRQFLKTGTWPDKTMFVLEIRASETEGSINHNGQFQTEIGAVEAEVKDNGRWTFYGFGKEKVGKAFPRTANCYSCHADHAAVDNTFVQFYPTLIPIAKEKKTYKLR